MMPVKGWTARGEINNLAFTNDGDWVGCVSGTTLKVLHVREKGKKGDDYTR